MRSIFIISVLAVAMACSAQSGGSGKFSEIQASKILEMIDAGENICFDSCIIHGDLDFTQLKNVAKIASSIEQVAVNSAITFMNCIFLGKVSAYSANPCITAVFARNLSFIDCDFREQTDFTECVIEGNAFFSGSKFRKTAIWQSVFFKHKIVYFNKTEFEDEAFFQNSLFACNVNFLHAKFAKSAMFQKCRAAGLMMFGNAKFNGYADFSYVFTGEFIFKYAEFNGRYDFSYSNIDESNCFVPRKDD